MFQLKIVQGICKTGSLKKIYFFEFNNINLKTIMQKIYQIFAAFPNYLLDLKSMYFPKVQGERLQIVGNFSTEWCVHTPNQ